MYCFSRTIKRAAIGTIVGAAAAVFSLPAANMWIRNPNINDMFEGHYTVLFSVAAFHGLLCGVLMGRFPQKSLLGSSLFGGVIGLMFAFLIFFGWTFILSAYAVFIQTLPPDTPLAGNSSLVILWSLFFGTSFYAGIYLYLLAIPSVVHGILIRILTDKESNLSRLDHRYR